MIKKTDNKVGKTKLQRCSKYDYWLAKEWKITDKAAIQTIGFWTTHRFDQLLIQQK